MGLFRRTPKQEEVADEPLKLVAVALVELNNSLIRIEEKINTIYDAYREINAKP